MKIEINVGKTEGKTWEGILCFLLLCLAHRKKGIWL
jgi:hypothetical protein